MLYGHSLGWSKQCHRSLPPKLANQKLLTVSTCSPLVGIRWGVSIVFDGWKPGPGMRTMPRFQAPRAPEITKLSNNQCEGAKKTRASGRMWLGKRRFFGMRCSYCFPVRIFLVGYTVVMYCCAWMWFVLLSACFGTLIAQDWGVHFASVSFRFVPLDCFFWLLLLASMFAALPFRKLNRKSPAQVQVDVRGPDHNRNWWHRKKSQPNSRSANHETSGFTISIRQMINNDRGRTHDFKKEVWTPWPPQLCSTEETAMRPQHLWWTRHCFDARVHHTESQTDMFICNGIFAPSCDGDVDCWQPCCSKVMSFWHGIPSCADNFLAQPYFGMS